MNRRHFLMSLGVAVAAAPMAWAQTYAEQIVQQLVDQGYVNIQVEATLLGRIRIRADGAQGQREIILNPRTGEILRDIWFDASGKPVPGLANSSGNAGSGSGSDDNGGDDNSGSDGGDDNSGPDGGDDNSGSGGGDDNSGSGSGSGDDDKGDDRDDKNNRD